MDKKVKPRPKTKLELLDLKRKAKRLYLTDGLTGKDIASILHVSEKSISTWINEYGWIEKKEDALYVRQPGVTIAKLQSILKKLHPELVETIEKVFNEKLKD